MLPACYVRGMAARGITRTSGTVRGDIHAPKGRLQRATKAQQAARGRFLRDLAAKGRGPSDEAIEAVLRELEGG